MEVFDDLRGYCRYFEHKEKIQDSLRLISQVTLIAIPTIVAVGGTLLLMTFVETAAILPIFTAFFAGFSMSIAINKISKLVKYFFQKYERPAFDFFPNNVVVDLPKIPKPLSSPGPRMVESITIKKLPLALFLNTLSTSTQKEYLEIYSTLHKFNTSS